MWGFGHRVGVVAVPHVSPGRLCGVIVERCVFCLCVSTLPLICVSWLHVSMTIHSFYIRAIFGPTVHCVVITPETLFSHSHRRAAGVLMRGHYCNYTSHDVISSCEHRSISRRAACTGCARRVDVVAVAICTYARGRCASLHDS